MWTTGSGRLIMLVAASTMAAVSLDCPAVEFTSTRRMCEPTFREPHIVMDEGMKMTKRAKREMMQRDFARGGNRPGRRRRNRMEGTRWKA